MSPQECIAALDNALAQGGEWMILRRVVGQAPNTANVDVRVLAMVRAFKPEELVGGISQTDSLAIISPTQIVNSQWPGGQPPQREPFVTDTRAPKINDKVIIQGRLRTISFVKPFYLNQELVRIELTVAG